MLYIDQVTKKIDSHGCEVINKVYYTPNLNEKATLSCTKREMINHMNNHPNLTVKTKYKKYSYWFEGAEVHVVDNEYLRTDGNNIKADTRKISVLKEEIINDLIPFPIAVK